MLRPRPSMFARALNPVWFLSALAVGAVLFLASPPAIAQATDSTTPTPTITLSADPSRVAESDSPTLITVTATASVAVSSDVVASIYMGGKGDRARRGYDYDIVEDINITITSGNTIGTGTFTLSGTNDNMADEWPEYVTLFGTLSTSDFTLIAGFIYITDVDTMPTTINLSVDTNTTLAGSQQNISEGDAATRVNFIASFPVGSSMSALYNTTATVTVGKRGDSASLGYDYKYIYSFDIVIRAGYRSGSTPITFTVLDDSFLEGSETITISGKSRGFTVNSSSDFTILDNDIILTIDTDASTDGNQTTIEEDDGTAVISITARVSSGSNRLGRNLVIPIQVGREDDTAGKGVNKDYTVTSPSSASSYLTIASGMSAGSISFTLSINEDGLGEQAEVITFVGNLTGFSIKELKITIEDNDILLKVTPGSVLEPDGVVDLKIEAILPRNLIAIRKMEITVSVGTTGDSATAGTDYTAVDDFTITIPARHRSGFKNVDFALLDDGLPNSPKMVTFQGNFRGQDTINARRYDEFDDASLTINSPPRIRLDFDVYTLGPGGSRTNIREATIEENSTDTLKALINYTVSGSTSVRSLPISFSGSATNTVDYSVGLISVPIDPLVSTATIDFPFTLIDDNIAEGSEKIVVSGSLDGYYVYSDVFTLEDNEVAPTIINLSVDTDDSTTAIDLEVMEGSTADVRKDVRVTASFPANSASLPADTIVPVTVTAAGDATAENSDFSTDQYDSVNKEHKFNITIPAGATSGSEKFVLIVKNDNVANEGDETVMVLGSVSGFTVNPTSFEITGDVDVAPNTVVFGLQEGNGSIDEDDGEIDFEIKAKFTNENALETDTKITLTISGGTATLGSTGDFTYSIGGREGGFFNITIPAEKYESSQPAKFTLTIKDDRIYEGAETILVSGSASGFTINSFTLDIVDNEIADLSENNCNAGVGNFITDSTKRDLIEDCKVLVALRNLWSPNLSNNHPLRKWGVGNNLSITSWSGVTIENDRVTKLLLPGDDNNGRIDAPIPGGFGNLVGLKEIDLSGNKISGNLYSTTTLTNLVKLDFSDNELDSAIPSLTSWGSSLESLDLSNNALTGTIFGEMRELTSLEILDLSDNITNMSPGLTGVIPGKLGNLSSLESLDLSGNSLTGAIPGNLKLLSNLERLDLSDNRLDGAIPGDLKLLSSLESLDLSGNRLTGVIPGKLGDLSSLESLVMSGNRLTGVIPGKLGDLSSLESLDISNNLLTGNIPGRLDRLISTTPNTGLQEFRFCGNNLTGSLSASMRRLGDKLDLPNSSVNYSDISVCRRSIDLSVETSSVSENSGTTEISVFATLTGYGATGLSPLPEADLVVTILVESGTADVASGTLVNDFTTNKLSSGKHQLSLTIPKSSIRGSAKFNLIVVNDSVTEDDETVKITAEAAGYAVNDAEVEITDDD